MFKFQSKTYFDWLPLEIHEIIARHLRELQGKNYVNKLLINEFKDVTNNIHELNNRMYQHSDKWDRLPIPKYDGENRAFVRNEWYATYNSIWNFLRVEYYLKNDEIWKYRLNTKNLNSYYQFINYHFKNPINMEYRWIDNFIKQPPELLDKISRDMYYNIPKESYYKHKKRIYNLYYQFFDKEPPKGRKTKELINDMLKH